VLVVQRVYKGIGAGTEKLERLVAGVLADPLTQKTTRHTMAATVDGSQSGNPVM